MNLKNLVNQFNEPDFGETYYLVDANYRPVRQGWTKPDGTGPLDLYAQRNPGRVFGSGGGASGGMDYATDSAAFQAALDAMVDFRNDKLLLTPGVAINVPGCRILGPPVRHPKRSLVTVTAAVDAAYTISVDDVEIGYHTPIPLPATNTTAL